MCKIKKSSILHQNIENKVGVMLWDDKINILLDWITQNMTKENNST